MKERETKNMQSTDPVKEENGKEIFVPDTLRAYKDTVFRMLFREKEELLMLFNAINQTHYENPDELEVNTLENAIYLNMKNDVSCVLDFNLNLYEHQSTVNPNMPLRDLFYVARLYEKIIRNENLYAGKSVKIPAPRFITFYNGDEEQPEKKLFRLSDLYHKKTGNDSLELIVLQLNINAGYNTSLMEQCTPLSGYMMYVDKVRKYKKQMPVAQALDRAVRECIEEGCLAEFFTKNRSEVIQMSIFEYDQEQHMRMIHEEGKEEGLELGLEQGIEQGAALALIRIIIKMKCNGMTVEEIAGILEEDIEKIRKIGMTARKLGTENPEKIYVSLQH